MCKKALIKQLSTELLIDHEEILPANLIHDELRRGLRVLANQMTSTTCLKKRIGLSAQRIAKILLRIRPQLTLPIDNSEEMLVLGHKCLQLDSSGTRFADICVSKVPPGVRRTNQTDEIIRKALQRLSSANDRGDLLLLLAHGSLSTEDGTEFSDLDFMAVFKDRCFHSDKAVKTLLSETANFNKFIQQIDPLSHHGIFVLSEKDLSAYDESYLPIRQLLLSSRIHGHRKITLGLRSCRMESGRQLLRHAIGIRERPSDVFSVKLFLSRIHLIPAIFLQSIHGLYIDKKTAIEMASSIYPRKALRAVEMASELREKWCCSKPMQTISQELIVSARYLSNYCLSKLITVAQSLVETDTYLAQTNNINDISTI